MVWKDLWEMDEKAKKRFFSRTVEQPCKSFWAVGPCLVWQGYLDEWGYGRFSYIPKGSTAKNTDGRSKKKTVTTHRASWIIKYAQNPRGKLVLHLCNNPSCVNVEHLYIGTFKDNALDQLIDGTHTKSKNTHCPNGHEYTYENTIIVSISKYKDEGHYQRQCKECNRKAMRNWYHRNKDRRCNGKYVPING